ncbi:FAD-dependent oxidoreductase [Nesterenkonia flava]|uniref:NAD(P)-binding domain-containing protein n=1 Tax=Nesterenkonia flava TaxID=469799 RepID=A0ABU1FXN3_9MICC|nr:FAD-dependent oxidoreductase [Nesterenkonia flava]MDR5713017.1 NAD(P)-binding domain-containing protein [Nesterenkonia flava]
MNTQQLPVAVIGAGPVGLAAASHLLEHGLEPLVLEAGDAAGAAVSQWGHIRLFSPWQYNIDSAARRLLEQAGWDSPHPTALPTGAELVEGYLRPLAATPELRHRIRFGTKVIQVSRNHEGLEAGGFLLRTEGRDSSDEVTARAVIDASGTWGQPNSLGRSGRPVPGEQSPAVQERMLGALPDVLGTHRERLKGQRIMVVGSGHSAINTLLSLAALQLKEPTTEIWWAIRGTDPERSYGGGPADQLPQRGALGQQLRQQVHTGRINLLTAATVDNLDATDQSLTATFTDGRELTVNWLASATGFRPDHTALAELELDLDPVLSAPRQLAPLIDPALHSCGTVPAHGADVLGHPEPHLFITGMKSYGTAPTFLMATGYEQVRSIAARLAGQDASARDLDLPQTGVCTA